jgi:hypothetical protein
MAPIQFKLTLYGKNMISELEKAELRKIIGLMLNVPPSSIYITEHRRLMGSTRRLAAPVVLAIRVPATAQARIPEVEAAVLSGSLANMLRSTAGFTAMTHIRYVSSTGVVYDEQTTQTTSAAPSTSTVIPAPAPKPPPPAVLPGSEVAVVYIVMGLKEEPPERKDELNTPKWERGFGFEAETAQTALEEICKRTPTEKARLNARETKCFVEDFRAFLQIKGQQYPLPGMQVHQRLFEFMESFYGKPYRELVGFSKDGSRLLWLRVKTWTNLPVDMAAKEAWEWSEKWDKYVEEINGLYRGSGTGAMFHISELWVRAQTETRLIESTLTCAAVSVAFSLLAVMMFLGNLVLAVYLILCIVCVIICLAATMFGIIGWKFGAVEAVGLIVFVGFSVDYSLHMAESFRASKEVTRFAKVRDALWRTSGAISAAAVTSMLAGVPILLCTIQVFVKFGWTIVLSTMLSWFFSLVFFCAVLLVIGPVGGFGSCGAIKNLIFGSPKKDGFRDLVVPGTVVGISSAGVPQGNPLGSYDGYKWDTGEGDDEYDPKNPKKGPQKGVQKGAPMEVESETAASSVEYEDNGAVAQENPELTEAADVEPPGIANPSPEPSEVASEQVPVENDPQTPNQTPPLSATAATHTASPGLDTHLAQNHLQEL